MADIDRYYTKYHTEKIVMGNCMITTLNECTLGTFDR